MKKSISAVVFLLIWCPTVIAQSDILIETETGRTQGLLSRSPAVIRAILSMPENRTDTALLFFRGSPGISRITSVGDKNRNLIPFLRANQNLFLNAGIAMVVMDCPTDEWGADGHFPTACLDNYRSSKKHADDVRAVMTRLKSEHGLSRIFILGHSYGTISSRWLARNLGHEIAGSIHSAAMNVPNQHGSASTMPGFDYNAISAPVVHVHHADDACRFTPFSTVKHYAGDKLIAVTGGEPEGDACGGKHFHSYRGREAAVVHAMVRWIKSGEITSLIGQ